MIYEDMSDFEINKRVEKLTGMYCEDSSGKYVPTCDYCNNPSDAWPIIVENKININTYAESMAFGISPVNGKFVESWYKNPLRAAMIVYLMMQEDK